MRNPGCHSRHSPSARVSANFQLDRQRTAHARVHHAAFPFLQAGLGRSHLTRAVYRDACTAERRAKRLEV